MDESSRAEFIDESMIGLVALNLECTSEWRRKKAEQYPNDNRNIAAAEKLSELASQVRQLKGSPLHLEFDNFHRQLLDEADSDLLSSYCETRYTTLLRAVELWGAVQADGLGRSAGDEELPPVDGLVGCREEDFSQQIKANPEDRLSTAFVGLDDDRPVFRLPFTGGVGERKGHSQHSEKLADPVGVNEVGVLEIEAPRLGGRKKRFDRPPPPIVGQGDLGIGVGGDHKQVSADQPRRSQFQCRSKRAVA